ncbi:MAG TPA: glycosyltransferase family 2 protein, partial [Actinomycetota bacterium]|nr:glycosyltransferase family 2 protein [Actinomycetota bacterium]
MSSSPPATVDAVVIVPTYNERDSIEEVARRLFAAATEGVDLLVVDDGSPDDTSAAAETAGARVLRLPRNQGKGAALAAGFRASTG